MTQKITQNYKLATLLQSGELVSVEKIQETLGIARVSVAVYIFDLRKKFKAEIENVRGEDGTKIVGYKLLNKIDVPPYRSNNAQISEKPKSKTSSAEKPTDGSVPVLDTEVTTLSDKALADVHDQLGLNEGGFNRME